jgi:hypothetical protein
MTKHSVARIVSSILGVYGGFLGFEHGIGEILQGNLAVQTIRINAYGSAGLPFPFGHEPAMTLLPTFLLTGIAAVLTALLIMIWSAFFTPQKSTPLVLLLLSILLLFVGGGYGPIPILILTVIAGFEARSQFGIWRKLPLILRRFLALSWKWFVAMIFIVILVSIPWGYVSGMNDPSFSRETYTSLAMATGLLQVFFALLAVFAAAANDSLSAYTA